MRRNMQENFELLLPRVIDSLEKSDLIKMKDQIEDIKGNTIITSVGGSSVVAEFLNHILNGKNIAVCKSPRDLKYENIDRFDNIFGVSYSGKGYVVDSMLNNKKKKYLLTNNLKEYDTIEKIEYKSSIEKEHSFISLASTLMPISILLSTKYNIETKDIIIDIFDKIKKELIEIRNNNVYEIIYGNEVKAAANYLETTMIESAIALSILHEKYNFCHGRTTTSYDNENGLILFNSDKEYDKIILEEWNKYYTELIKIDKYSDEVLLNEYYMILKCMYLTKKLAENKNKDLSSVEYSPFVKKLYFFKGDM